MAGRCTMIVATRGGELGRRQAREVTHALATRFPEELELLTIETEEMDAAVFTGKADVAVHRMEHLPLALHRDLAIAAILPRHAFTDSLVSSFSLADLPHGARVAISNARRRAQLLRARPDVAVVEAFGEVSERVKKWRVGEFDGIVLSTAGLKRAGVEAPHAPLDPDAFVPSPGQGALGCVCKRGSRFEEFLEGIDDERARTEVEVERAVLRGLGGDVRSPVGVHAAKRAPGFTVHAVVLSLDGKRAVSVREGVPARDPLYGADEIAEKLRRMGGDVLLAEARKALG